MSRTLAATRWNWSSLTVMTPRSRSNEYPALSAMCTSARVSFGRQLPPEPGTRLQELVADALVVAHAQHDVLDVGAHGLAHGGDGVDEADLRGEEGVGGVLDGLGRRRVGDDDRGGHADVEGRHPDGCGLVVAADDDAVRVEEVVHRRALTEELGVGHHDHVVAAQHPLDHPGRSDRHRRLVDHHGLRRQHGTDLAGGRLDVGQVGGTVVALGRRHAQVGELGGRHGVGRPDHEAEPPTLQTLPDQRLEAGLDDRHLARASAGRPWPRRCRHRRRRARGGRSTPLSSARRNPPR